MRGTDALEHVLAPFGSGVASCSVDRAAHSELSRARLLSLCPCTSTRLLFWRCYCAADSDADGDSDDSGGGFRLSCIPLDVSWVDPGVNASMGVMTIRIKYGAEFPPQPPHVPTAAPPSPPLHIALSPSYTTPGDWLVSSNARAHGAAPGTPRPRCPSVWG